jgi:ferredoxin--NADP+ reductase
MSEQSRTLRVAVVGSGPSGFYAAEAVLRGRPDAAVDLFERLPAPYGLVRYGVAPDSQHTKDVTRLFEQIAGHPAFRFLGNVEVGRDLPVETLRGLYHAVILAAGAAGHRRLNIPGEDLPGSWAANDFCGWYNGHPDFADRSFDLAHSAAVIIGNGNVAIDAARMLARTPEELGRTDMPDYALRALGRSQIRDIYLLGRRGPAQASFTHPELEELGQLADAELLVDPGDLELNEASAAELADPKRFKSRHVYDLLAQYAQRPAGTRRRRLRFRFGVLPVRLEGAGRVERLVIEKGALQGGPGAQRVRGTGTFETIPCGLVIRCIGYHGEPMPGVPFDEAAGVIPNDQGRVVDRGEVVPGLYAVGWIRHGPIGLIGTTRRESRHVVAALLQDLAGEPAPRPGPHAVLEALSERGVPVVSFADWRKVDALELARGRQLGKPREKLVRREDLLRAAFSA